MPCSLVKVNWHFKGIYCFHLKGQRLSQASKKQAASNAHIISQKTEPFAATAVRTSNPTYVYFLTWVNYYNIIYSVKFHFPTLKMLYTVSWWQNSVTSEDICCWVSADKHKGRTVGDGVFFEDCDKVAWWGKLDKPQSSQWGWWCHENHSRVKKICYWRLLLATWQTKRT
jgi:hypothetical protein